jgi:hypothetical protein
MKWFVLYFRKFPKMGSQMSDMVSRSFFRATSCSLWIIEPLFGKTADYSRVPGSAEMMLRKNCWGSVNLAVSLF